MSAIGPGDWVEFVGKPDGYVNPTTVLNTFEVGSVYCVSEVGRRCVDGAKQIWESIRLKGFPAVNRMGRPTSFPMVAFRPIYRPKPDAFTDLLKIPTKESAR